MNGQYFILKAKHGITMVEVIVAFLILIIVMQIFSQAAVLAVQMVRRSEESMRENRNLAGSCYLEGQSDPDAGKAKAITPVVEAVTLRFQSEGGASFQIPARVRTFSGADGKLYDVVGARWQEDSR